MSDNIKLIIEIPESYYNAICANKEGLIIAYDACHRIAHGIPLDFIKTEIEKLKDEAETIFGHELAFDKIYAYKRCLDILDNIDKADFPQAKDIEPTVENFSKVLDNELIRDAIKDCETDM